MLSKYLIKNKIEFLLIGVATIALVTMSSVSSSIKLKTRWYAEL
jgi:hypothetical protein